MAVPLLGEWEGKTIDNQLVIRLATRKEEIKQLKRAIGVLKFEQKQDKEMLKEIRDEAPPTSMAFRNTTHRSTHRDGGWPESILEQQDRSQHDDDLNPYLLN